LRFRCEMLQLPARLVEPFLSSSSSSIDSDL
jgi:hypothetical protein